MALEKAALWRFQNLSRSFPQMVADGLACLHHRHGPCVSVCLLICLGVYLIFCLTNDPVLLIIGAASISAISVEKRKEQLGQKQPKQ